MIHKQIYEGLQEYVLEALLRGASVNDLYKEVTKARWGYRSGRGTFGQYCRDVIKAARKRDDPRVDGLDSHNLGYEGVWSARTEEYFLKLQLQKQRLQDTSRIERKTIRRKNRIDNALISFSKELIKAISARPPYPIKKHQSNGEEYVGILQVSDCHLNELVELENNRYDFPIAAKRLQKYVCEARKIFIGKGVKNVLVFFTGDNINSDRRLDELLSMATNRAQATIMASVLFEQMIIDLNQDFNVTIAHVTGNESRVKDEYGAVDIMVSDNYDTMIHEILRVMFRGSGVEFIDGPSHAELVVQVNEKSILAMHGQQIAKASICKSIQQIKAKYGDKGIIIDFVIFGHLHECLIADLYARSSSLVGSNAYSDRSLQLTSRASQNIHLVGKGGTHSVKIDLQEFDGYEGYNIDQSLLAYNTKSVDKSRPHDFLVIPIFERGV